MTQPLPGKSVQSYESSGIRYCLKFNLKLSIKNRSKKLADFM